MLTEHQILHLNAVILDCKEALDSSQEMRSELASNKQINPGLAISYFNLVIKDAKKILKNEIFPDLEYVWEIHDYLEKRREL